MFLILLISLVTFSIPFAAATTLDPPCVGWIQGPYNSQYTEISTTQYTSTPINFVATVADWAYPDDWNLPTPSRLAVTVIFHWGDGTTTTQYGLAGRPFGFGFGNNFVASHSWASPGIYVVWVEIINCNGQSDCSYYNPTTITMNIIAYPSPPPMGNFPQYPPYLSVTLIDDLTGNYIAGNIYVDNSAIYNTAYVSGLINPGSHTLRVEAIDGAAYSFQYFSATDGSTTTNNPTPFYMSYFPAVVVAHFIRTG